MSTADVVEVKAASGRGGFEISCRGMKWNFIIKQKAFKAFSEC
jgi:hypothetical protein